MQEITTQEALPENPTDKLVADALNNTDKPLTEQQQIFKTFQDTLNEFIKKVGEFKGSKRQLQNVLTCLAISPLNKEEFHFGYPDEEELFDLCTSVNSSKFFLMVNGLADQGKIAFIEQEKLAEATPEVVEAETKETVNG